MTDIMKLAEAMAVAMAGDKDALALIEARAALQSAIEALQKEVSTLDVLLEECKMDWSGDVTQLKAEHKHEIDALQSKLDAMGKGEPVAHVYAIERTGRPLVAWDDARGIGLGDKLYATPEAMTEVINKARIFGLGLPIVQTERLIKAIESLKEPTP